MTTRKYTWRISFLLLFSLFVGMNVMGAENTGRNDTVLVNTGIIDNLSTTSEYDIYTAKLTSPGSLTVKFDHVTKSRYSVIVNKIESDGTLKQVQSTDFTSSATTATGRITEYSNKLRLPAGNYSVKVQNYSYESFSSSNYELTLVYTAETPAHYELEFNDTIQSSNVINVNTDYTGNIANYTDSDYYSFVLATKGSIQLSLNYATKSKYTLELYYLESNGTLTSIQQTDFSTSSSSVTGKVTTLSDKIRVPQGTYFLKLTHYSYDYYTNEDYTFKVLNTVEGANAETEFNDALSQANAIAVNSDIIGNLSNYKDVDYFTFSVSGYTLYRTRFTYHPDGDYIVTLYSVDSTGKINEILASNFTNSNNIKTTGSLTEYGNSIGLYTGNYIVSVKTIYDDYNNADYHFYFQKINPITKPGKVTSFSAKNIKTKTISLSFKKVTGAKGYQIAYSTSKTFRKNTTYKFTTSTSLKLKKLTKKKTYHIKVRAYKLSSIKSKIYGTWSAVKKVTIKK